MNFDNTHIDNLIAKYLVGEASEKEWEELSLWMESSPENKKHFEGIRFVHDKAVASHRIVKVDVDKAWQKLSSQMVQPAEKPTVPIYKKSWFRVAASIAIVLGISALLYFLPSGKATGTHTFASADTITTHNIASTEITLNRNSKVVYKLKKSGKERELQLTGEAFIEVRHSADTVLIVKAGETLIRDIGTSFNVKAYPDSQTVEVYVQEGEVAFYSAEQSGVLIKAGETGVYNRMNKEFSKKGPVDINTIAYKSKLFVFRNIRLSKAISALNSVYTKKYELANPSLSNCTITVTFDREEPAAIAEIIAETLGLQLSETDNKFILDGESCSSQP